MARPDGLGDEEPVTVTDGLGEADDDPVTDGDSDVVPVTDSVGEPDVDGETEVETLTVADTDCEVVGLTCGARDDGEARGRGGEEARGER